MKYIKNTHWAEKIGFSLVTIGFLLVVMDSFWETNPIPSWTKNGLLINAIGLFIWAFGNAIRRRTEKKEKE